MEYFKNLFVKTYRSNLQISVLAYPKLILTILSSFGACFSELLHNTLKCLTALNF